MSLPSLDRSHATQTSPIQASNASALGTPVSEGVCSIRETVSSAASTCPCDFFQPVIDFFASVLQAIGDLFKPVFDIFNELMDNDFSGLMGNDFSGLMGRSTTTEVPVSLSHFRSAVYQGLTVNVDKIPQVPQMLDPSTVRAITNGAQPPVQLDELLTHFDRICHQYAIRHTEVLFREGDQDITVEKARKSLEEKYLDLVNGFPLEKEIDRIIVREIKDVLQGIILELRPPRNGDEEDIDMIAQKKVALEDLCRAAMHCRPRRHTEAFRVYSALSKQIETVDEIVKLYLQEIKESLLLTRYYSTQPVHTLNYIRREVGVDLGLDTRETHLRDPHIKAGRLPNLNRSDILAVFPEIYTPENILFGMKNLLNHRIVSNPEFACMLSEFIDHEIQIHEAAGRLVAADRENMPMPYQDPASYQLTDAGIKFLMVHLGYLNSETPNGHLVRAEGTA